MTPYATIGRKLGHSYSKLIHQAFGKYDFSLIELEADEARDFILHAPYKGITITIPYKKLALELADEVAPGAKRIGCANTLLRRADGTLLADNTDYAGFAYMARQAGVDFAGAKVLILGSGATSLTTRCVAEDSGARQIVIVSRTGDVNYSNVAALHSDADIIINATPVGMYPDTAASPVSLADFPHLRGVLDVVYNPMRTRLKLQAAQRGLACGDGLKMLVAQAKYCMDIFLGSEQPEALIPQVTGLIRRQTANIVLIGMPGSGKSTIAREVAQRLGRRCVDLDDVITERIGCTIEQYFHEHGEDAFRQKESEVLAEFAKQSGLVIATGGGAVLREENRINLANNGYVFLIERPLDALATGNGRPLSANREAVTRLYEQRAPIYRQSADFVIDNTGNTTDAAVNQLISCFNENSCN